MKLTEAIKGYILDGKISPQTPSHIHQKRQRLNRFVSWCEAQSISDLEEVTANTVKGFIVYLQEHILGEEEKRARYRGKTLSPISILGYTRVVRSFFNWCEKEGLLDGRPNPIKRLPRIKIPKKVIQAYSPDALHSVLEECDTSSPIGFRNYTIFLLLVDTGIRVSELSKLQLIDIHDDYIKVFGKFSKEREVGVSPTTSRALWKYVHQFRKPVKEDEQRVFLSSAGTPLHPKSLWFIINNISKQAGVTNIRTSPHTLRHTFAKSWLINGGDVVSLSRVLGHADVQTTAGYLEDFKDSDARREHIKRSPVEILRLGRKHKPKE